MFGRSSGSSKFFFGFLSFWNIFGQIPQRCHLCVNAILLAKMCLSVLRSGLARDGAVYLAVMTIKKIKVVLTKALVGGGMM